MRKVLPCSKTSYKVKKRIERVRHQHLITGDGWGRGYKKAFLCCGKGTICWVFVGSLPRCSTALPQQAVSSYLPTRQTHFVSISRLTSCCLLNDLQIFQSWREKKNAFKSHLQAQHLACYHPVPILRSLLNDSDWEEGA